MINELTKEEARNSWDQLLVKLPKSNFYQSFSNGQIKGIKNKDRYLLYYDGNELLAMFMCLCKKNKVSIPFGPIYRRELEEKQLLEILLDVKKYFNTNLVFSLESDVFDKYSNIVRKYPVYWDFTTVQIDVGNKTFEEVRKGFNSNRKRIIKKCLNDLRDSIIVDDRNNIDIFYKLFVNRLNDTHGEIDVNLDYLTNMVEQKNTGLLMCFNKELIPMSGLIYYSFNDTLITRYNAFDSKFAHYNPGTYLDYYMINKAINSNNISFYDLSGIATGDNIDEKALGINRYKESYGPTKVLHYKWFKIED